GDDILKSLRNKQKDTPVIFITAKDSIHDRVAGLDLGANDYLVKPFSLEELSARVRAQLRQKQQTPNHILQWQDLSLDTQAKTVMKAGQSINLTAKEFQILYKLMQKP
ncbi:response regulator transcription factor, partial [Escherichia coli]|uniref:response regulator transcription factor n=2 Tax=Gammaproteobacteria TaxID=1236 RepID=UPI001C493EC2